MFMNEQMAVLRPLQESDGALVLKWRNSERIRKASHHQEIIKESEHSKWLRTILHSTDRAALIFEWQDRPIGLVQYRAIGPSTVEWGFYRGENDVPKGMGLRMCRMALDEIFARFPDGLVMAEVLKSNPKSFDFHLKLGFQPVPSHESKQSGDFWTLRLPAKRWREGKAFQVENKWIGPGHKPFIVAEMSGNHNQSLDRALAIVDAAAEAGAHGLKIQTYTADTMTLDLNQGEFSIRDAKSLWNGRSLYDLYKEAAIPWQWHEPILKRCRELGMIGFSTPFDETAVDFLESLNVPLYKIASFEMTDLPLIERVAKTKKPIILSTGMATAEEIEEAIATARRGGCEHLVVLKCTSTYPASPENTNIVTMADMRERFRCHVGLSDHTMGIGTAVASVALGAVLVEKHFTLRRADGGVDSAFSLEPEELKSLVVESERAWQSLGACQYGPTEKEKASLQFRRSLYVVHDLKAGDTLTKENLRPIRPGLGLPPKFYHQVLGRKILKDAAKGTPLAWNYLEDL